MSLPSLQCVPKTLGHWTLCVKKDGTVISPVTDVQHCFAFTVISKRVMESLLKIPLHLRRVAADTYTLHTDATVLWPIFRDYEGEPVPEENLLLDFMVQRKITERGRHTDNPYGRHPFRTCGYTTMLNIIGTPCPCSPMVKPLGRHVQ